MLRIVPALALIALAAPLAAEEERPLSIEIYTGIAFNRMALTGRNGGTAAIDPQTGSHRDDEGLVALGGMAVTGQGRITGTPLRTVRIDLPARVVMTTPEGASAELTDLTTNLPAFPTLDEYGVLEFAFGGTLNVASGSSGRFRGRIPISVDYN